MKFAVRTREVSGVTKSEILTPKEGHEPAFALSIQAIPAIVADGMRAAGFLPLTHYQMKMQDEHGTVIEVNIKYNNKDTSAILDRAGIPTDTTDFPLKGGHHDCEGVDQSSTEDEGTGD